MLRKKNSLIQRLRWISSVSGLTGGIIVASNTEISRYGYIFLALSSLSLGISSYLDRDTSLIVYSASLFIFCDLFGLYCWLFRSL